MKSLMLLATILLIKVTFSCSSNDEINNLFLPKNIVPKAYTIHIKPQIYYNEFIGKNKLELIMRNNTNRIVFHCGKNIQINSLSLVNSQKGVMSMISLNIDKESEQVVVIVNDTMPASSLTELSIDYRGNLLDNMKGIYAFSREYTSSNIFDSNGTLMHLIGTHFQPIYARYAFPCFDEPPYKTIFTIFIYRPKSFLSVCNLPLITVKSLNNYTEFDMYRSDIPLSTFQISFFIMKFTCILNRQDTIRVCVQPQHNNYAIFALNIGEKARDFFLSLFYGDNRLSLVTMIGVPNKVPEITASFKLLAFSEDRFLHDPMLTSNIDREKIITTIFHGWASMFLEHIFTPEEWSDMWLNKGIATYLSYHAAFETASSRISKQQVIVDHVHPALLEDGLGHSKPLTRKITTLTESEKTQDIIVLSKGCSIVRMMHLMFGTDVFQLTLVEYITSRKTKTSTSTNFWLSYESLIYRSHLKLPTYLLTIMNSWTTKSGYPVLHVNLEKNKIKLSQEKFTISNLKMIPDDNIWWIPLTWASASNPDFETTSPKYWFYKNQVELNLNITNSDWVVFNVQRTGFYRVNYDQKLWSRIITELRRNDGQTIPPISRAMILDDLFNLARAGVVSYNITLECVSYITQEMEYLPVEAALNGLQYLYERFADQEYSMIFNNFFLKLILPIYNKLNNLASSQSSSSMVFLQTEIDEWVCKLGYEKCHETMLNHFLKRKTDSAYNIPTNRKTLTYCIAIEHGLLADVINIFFSNANSIEKTYFREAFKCIQEKKILINLLKSVINDERYFVDNLKQSVSLFKSVARRNNKNAEFILEFILSNGEDMRFYFKDDQIIIDIINTASEVLSTSQNVKQLENLLNKFQYSSYFDYLNEKLDDVLLESLFYKKYHETIINWITEYEFIHWMPLENSLEVVNFKENQRILKSAERDNIIKGLEMIPRLYTFDYYSSREVLKFVKYLDDKFSGRYISEFFRTYIINIITPIYNKLGFEEKSIESIEKKLLRTEIVKLACLLENVDCKQKSRQLFNNWKTNSSILFPESLREIILCTAIKWGNKSDWSYLQRYSNKLHAFNDKDIIRQALGCTQNRKFIYDKLAFKVINNFKVKKHFKVLSTVDSLGLIEETLTFMLEKQMSIFSSDENVKIIENIFQDLLKHVTTRRLVQKYTECVNLYSKKYPEISTSLAKYVIEANTELLRFDDLSLQVLKWLFSTNSNVNHSLPKSIRPKRYNIYFLPHLNTEISNFHGFINITLNISSDTSYLVLNVGNLTISSVSIYVIYDMSTIPLNDILVEFKHVCIITLNMTVEAGTQLLVSISYKGSFNNNPNVFYRSFFTDKNKNKHWLAATQVDKYGAKELFPCFDETYFEASFQLSIKRPILYRSFTNMKLNSSESLSNEPSVWDHYEITKPILPHNIRILITNLRLSNSATDLRIWLRPHKTKNHTHTLHLQSKNNLDWIIVNIQQTGFYYVNDDLMTWEDLFQTLKKNKFGKISMHDRAQIISDLYNLAKENYISLNLFLAGTEYLIKERAVMPWQIFLELFHNLRNKFDNPKTNDGLEVYLLQLIKSVYKYTGFESKKNDTQSTNNLRKLILPWIVHLNDPIFINKSIAVFNEWRINADNCSFNKVVNSYEILCNALKHGGFDEWQFVWEYTLTLENSMIQPQLIRALTCTCNKTALNIYIRYIFTAENWINDSLKTLALTSLKDNSRYGFDLILGYLINNNSTNNYLWSIVSTLLPHMVEYPISASEVSKLMVFIQNNNSTISSLNDDFYKKLIELTECAKWYTDQASDVEFWLNKKGFIENSSKLMNSNINET